MNRHQRKYFSYEIQQNVGKGREDNLAQRLEIARSEIGEALFEKLEKANLIDLQLYSYVNLKLHNSIKKIDNFDSKLNDFKNRCKH